MEAWMVQLAGILVQTVLVIGAGYGLLVRSDANINSLKEDLKEMQTEIKALSDVVTKIAVQTVRIDSITERLNMQESRLNDLNRRTDKAHD